MKDKLIAKTRIFSLFSKKVKFNNNKVGKVEYAKLYDTLESVMVAPLTEKNELIFIKEYCSALDKTCLVFPGGVVDLHETPEEACIRELGEEAKLLAGNLEKIGVVEVLPKYIFSRTHLYLAKNLTNTDDFKDGDEVESLEMKMVELEELTGLITSGSITDSRTLALALLVKSRLAFNAS